MLEWLGAAVIAVVLFVVMRSHYMRSREQAVSRAKDEHNVSLRKIAQLEELLESARSQMDTKSEKLERCEKSLRELSVALQASETNTLAMQNAFDQTTANEEKLRNMLKQKQKDVIAAHQEQDNLRKQIHRLRNQLEDMAKTPGLLTKERDAFRARYEDEVNNASRLATELQELRDDYQLLQSTYDNLLQTSSEETLSRTEEANVLKKSVEDLSTRLRKADAVIQDQQAATEQLQREVLESKTTCAVVQKTLATTAAEKQSLQSEVSALSQNSMKLSQDFDAAQVELKTLKARLAGQGEELTSVTSENQRLQDELISISDRTAGMQNELALARDEESALRDKLLELESARDSLQAELRTAQDELELRRTTQEELQVKAIDESSMLTTELAATQERLRMIIAEKNNLERDVSELEEQNHIMREEITSKDEQLSAISLQQRESFELISESRDAFAIRGHFIEVAANYSAIAVPDVGNMEVLVETLVHKLEELEEERRILCNMDKAHRSRISGLEQKEEDAKQTVSVVENEKAILQEQLEKVSKDCADSKQVQSNLQGQVSLLSHELQQEKMKAQSLTKDMAHLRSYSQSITNASCAQSGLLHDKLTVAEQELAKESLQSSGGASCGGTGMDDQSRVANLKSTLEEVLKRQKLIEIQLEEVQLRKAELEQANAGLEAENAGLQQECMALRETAGMVSDMQMQLHQVDELAEQVTVRASQITVLEKELEEERGRVLQLIHTIKIAKGEFERVNAELDGERVNRDSHLRELRNANNDLSAQLLEAESKVRNLSKAQEELTEATECIGELETQVDILRGERSRLEVSLNDFQALVVNMQLEQTMGTAQLKFTAERLHEHIDELEAQLKAVNKEKEQLVQHSHTLSDSIKEHSVWLDKVKEEREVKVEDLTGQLALAVDAVQLMQGNMAVAVESWVEDINEFQSQLESLWTDVQQVQDARNVKLHTNLAAFAPSPAMSPMISGAAMRCFDSALASRSSMRASTCSMDTSTSAAQHLSVDLVVQPGSSDPGTDTESWDESDGGSSPGGRLQEHVVVRMRVVGRQYLGGSPDDSAAKHCLSVGSQDLASFQHSAQQGDQLGGVKSNTPPRTRGFRTTPDIDEADQDSVRKPLPTPAKTLALLLESPDGMEVPATMSEGALGQLRQHLDLLHRSLEGLRTKVSEGLHRMTELPPEIVEVIENCPFTPSQGGDANDSFFTPATHLATLLRTRQRVGPHSQRLSALKSAIKPSSLGGDAYHTPNGGPSAKSSLSEVPEQVPVRQLRFDL